MPSPAEERANRHRIKQTHVLAIAAYREALALKNTACCRALHSLHPELATVFDQLKLHTDAAFNIITKG
jgi:hypothetical protein